MVLCSGNSPVTGEFPPQRPVKRSFDGFFYLHLNKRLGKQSWGLWFGTPSRSLWRQCHVKWRWKSIIGTGLRATNQRYSYSVHDIVYCCELIINGLWRLIPTNCGKLNLHESPGLFSTAVMHYITRLLRPWLVHVLCNYYVPVKAVVICFIHACNWCFIARRRVSQTGIPCLFMPETRPSGDFPNMTRGDFTQSYLRNRLIKWLVHACSISHQLYIGYRYYLYTLFISIYYISIHHIYFYTFIVIQWCLSM